MNGSWSRSTRRRLSVPTDRSKIELCVIGFGRPDLLREQKRLLDKYLLDPYGICLIDNTPDDEAPAMEAVCRELSIGYQRAVSPKHLHPEALNFAALHVTRSGSEFFGFLDHDVFPLRPTSLVKILGEKGFYGVGQRHAPTGHRYLWPGFCFFSRTWLAGRSLNFDGIRGREKRDDGDCGSMNWPLFSDEDWQSVWSMEHSYKIIREPDDYGLQSFGIELIGDWVHLSNASHWMRIPMPHERDQILTDYVAAL